MDSPDISPEKVVKITYKSRVKVEISVPPKIGSNTDEPEQRKRDLEDDNDAQSVISVGASEIRSPASSSSKRSPAKQQASEMGPPDSLSKKLEFKVPEVSYKHQHRDSEIPDDLSVGKEKMKAHMRSKSSVTSLKQLQPISSSPSSSSQKPMSRSHKPTSSVSFRNPPPSESELDDGASVTESILSTTKVRRTEAERIEYFKNQPEASAVEPHQVTCLRCKKTISLGKRQTYAVKPWENHRTRCDAKVPFGLFDGTSPHVANENDNTSEVGATAATVRTKTTETQRKAILERDAADVKPDEALCKRCKKWIRLGAGKYSLGNWTSHKTRCGGAVPSSRVATAERKLRIVNDPRAKTFGPRHVECATCGKSIVLEGDADYTLTSWESHKTECSDPGSSDNPAKQAPFEIGSEPNSIPRPPPSVESSSTVVSPDGVGSSSPTKGTKRRLEEEGEDVVEPPSNKPRTESYVPTEREAPSALGWFLLPIRSFIRGFKESLSS